MTFKQVILAFSFVVFTVNHAFAFSSCQIKYDNDKRSLPSLHGKCNVCHISPNGGGPTNDFGKVFAEAGFKITDELVAAFPNLFQKVKEEPPSPGSTTTTSSGTAKPAIKRIKPNKVKVNIQSMAIIMGQNFTSGAKAFIDNNEVVTTFKSNVKLIINFILDTVGIHEVKVQNPDGQESNTTKIKAK